ncbi:MAG: hypothetical protein WDM90_18065 [Ferruginibacter sp.]
MSDKFGKYGEMNTGFTGEDVRGFTKNIWQPGKHLSQCKYCPPTPKGGVLPKRISKNKFLNRND